MGGCFLWGASSRLPRGYLVWDSALALRCLRYRAVDNGRKSLTSIRFFGLSLSAHVRLRGCTLRVAYLAIICLVSKIPKSDTQHSTRQQPQEPQEKPTARWRVGRPRSRTSGIGARRLPLETPNTEPLSRARGDEPQGE
eukprot:scaffold52746_cov32-Tisochrysis_lutea.AAC.1